MPLYFVNASIMCLKKGSGSVIAAIPVPSMVTLAVICVSRVSRCVRGGSHSAWS